MFARWNAMYMAKLYEVHQNAAQYIFKNNSNAFITVRINKNCSTFGCQSETMQNQSILKLEYDLRNKVVW